MTDPIISRRWNLTEDQAVEGAFTDLISKCPPAPLAQIRGAYKWLQTRWGCRALLSGTRVRIEEELRTNLRCDSQRDGFQSFSTGVYSDPCPVHTNVFSILKHAECRWKTFLGYRLWLSEDGLVFLAGHSDALVSDAALDLSWMSRYRQWLSVYKWGLRTPAEVLSSLRGFLCLTLPALPESSVPDVVNALCGKVGHTQLTGTWEQVESALVPLLARALPGIDDWRRHFAVGASHVRYGENASVLGINSLSIHADTDPNSVVLTVLCIDRLESSRAAFSAKVFRTPRRWFLLYPEATLSN